MENRITIMSVMCLNADFTYLEANCTSQWLEIKNLSMQSSLKLNYMLDCMSQIFYYDDVEM